MSEDSFDRLMAERDRTPKDGVNEEVRRTEEMAVVTGKESDNNFITRLVLEYQLFLRDYKRKGTEEVEAAKLAKQDLQDYIEKKEYADRLRNIDVGVLSDSSNEALKKYDLSFLLPSEEEPLDTSSY